MKRKRKGRVPPQLKRFVFRKGHRRMKMKRRIARRRNPLQAPAISHYIFARRGGGQRLHFDGIKFTTNGKPAYFRLKTQAETTAKELIRKFPILRTYDVYVGDTSKKH